jgi:hypothetical protein
MSTVADHTGLPVSSDDGQYIRNCNGGAAMADTVVTTNRDMIVTLVMIHRIACRALRDEERVGQRMKADPRSEIIGLLGQLMTIKELAHAGLSEEGLALLDLAVAKEETAAIRAEGRKIH